ncbi:MULTISPECIES: Na+/H+ antiporter NhaA [Rhodococcus]|uniref:Na(+)/H(+) antiporter NhaA n=1 Tax=Rhodococcus oxybenzonivorans TaxID=1990687 RepID=A0AAE4V3I3_9NOCA|nr:MULTISPECIES: Na+/H+ antiporter NhaA [Rhodococcus]MDV7245247.1 Na+/H+ antiporter NhaA [Rhodococcus oxybenzonivorans]MDV7267943.1 Na+/H+ antiporter NhaA [Rhodococcus oxybenzonivorans]MDV7272473.1 Na+/H+ antiporter NhaA [Rhodococcus oxybenzonivorans]MDV7336272.1 Na+/H+ antiporter NhaA [Rhodococcus oxybenzonivorans]MDV7342957.1 Na+/H+ antiporter NhaA [Rhodococcus oxybenzonivorans]
MAVEDNPTRLGRLSARLAGIRDGTDDDTLSASFLLVATVLALVWANIGTTYESFWHTPITIQVGEYGISLDLKHWVNDALMTLFFFVVGLEVKRELTIGELTDRARAAVPLVAAIAGLALPAALFLALNPSGDEAAAWGVVVSTDTAFVLGALALVGPRCPARLRVFILTLAVADDIGALAIIAFFYTDNLRLGPLVLGAVGLLLIMQLRRLEVWRGVAYFIVAAGTWVAFYESGVHPTLVGVLIALILPVYPPRRREVERAGELTRAFRQSPNSEYARAAQLGVLRAVSVNERLLRFYQPYTAFLVVPIFALANAGVVVTGQTLADAVRSPLAWGIVLGLVVGKFVGITASTALFSKMRPGSLPPGLNLSQISGGSALAGIGFTISLFIVDLAIESPVLANDARVGVLTAAVIATVLGWALFRFSDWRTPPTEAIGTTLLRPVLPGRDHLRGPVDAPLTLVEYGDFECPFCTKATGSIRDVRAHFGDALRYVFRHLPLDEVHPHARFAAHAAEAADRQGRFWEMHDHLFANSDALDEDEIYGYAAELGLDMNRFEEELRTGEYLHRVDDDELDAQTSDFRQTPTFYLGATGTDLTRHTGPFDAATLIRRLEEARDAQGD